MVQLPSDLLNAQNLAGSWPIMHKVAQLAQVRRAIKSRGVILTGPAGVGKTTMARMLLSEAQNYVGWVAGTQTAQAIPLGAFASLVDIPEVANPAAALRIAKSSLLRRCAATGAPLVAVDDAHLLDPLSATLLHQLAATRSARFVVTVRSDAPTPDAVSGLREDRLLELVELLPLSSEQTAQLMSEVLGGMVEQVSVDRIHKIAQGNPLYLRHLVGGVLKEGGFQNNRGVWQLSGPTVVDTELSALIGGKIDALAPGPLRALELVAFGEPLEPGVLHELAQPDDVEKLERQGLVSRNATASGEVMRLAHPIFGEVIRSRTPVFAQRRRKGELYTVLAAHGTDQMSRRLRVASLALGSDADPGPDLFVAAGRDALAFGELHLAEQLFRAAYDAGGGVVAASLLGFCIAWQGRGAEVEELLGSWDTTGMNDVELLLWGLPRAAALFWPAQNPPRAFEVIGGLRERMTQQFALDCVDSLDAMLSVYLGRPQAGLELALSVLGKGQALPLAEAWAAASAAMAVAQAGGPLEHLPEYVQRGMAAAQTAEIGLLRTSLGYAQVTALTLQGQIGDALRAGEEQVDFAQLQQPGAAIGDLILGRALLAAGDLAAAADRLLQAVAALELTGLTAWNFLAAAPLCEALAALGRLEDAERAMDCAERTFGADTEGFLGDRLLAQSWLLAVRGDLRGAVLCAQRAADAGAAAGFHSVEVLALVAGLRMGDKKTLPRLKELSAKLPGAVMLHLAARHAAAFEQRDAAALEGVAARYEQAGFKAWAADTYAQAAAAHDQLGSRYRRSVALAQVTRLSRVCGGLRTPAVDAVLNPLPLTQRELEIVILLRQGLSNRQIAQRLAVSVRTVEGHIYRACNKLNVVDRAALAQAHEGTPPVGRSVAAWQAGGDGSASLASQTGRT